LFPSTIGTESERSFAARDSQRRLLRQSVAGGQPVKPMKIAAINGKPKVSRYLSKECKLVIFILYISFIYF
jgi:hypothetical protein